VGEPEKTEVDAVAQMKAEMKRRREAEIKKTDAKTVTVNGVKMTGLLRSSGRLPRSGRPIDKEAPKEEPKAEFAEAPKTKFDEVLDEEIVIEAEGPKAAEDEEEALKAEEPVPVTDLSHDEEKKRRLIRDMKLKQLNVKYAVIRSYGGRCAVVTIGQSKGDLNKKVFEFQTKEAFEQWMANRFVPSLKKRNEKDAVGPWWFRHSRRREYDAVIFKPLAPQVITTRDRLKILNMYLGWGVEPKEGDWSLIRHHIRDVLANGDPGADQYIMNWNAWNVQHPDRLPEVALTLIGRKGTGKGTLARVQRTIFGSHSIQVSNIKHLTGTFNAYKENLILLVADEAYWGGHKGEAGELQRMITEDTLFIEPKYFNQYEAKNYIRLLILAEPGWVIPAGPNERRYAVFDVSDRHLEDRKYFKALHHQIDNGGAAAMLYDLQKMPLGDWHPREIYKTGALRHQQELSLPPMAEWMLGLLEDGELPGTQPGRLQQATPTSLLNDLHYKVPRAHDIGKNKLADFLKEEWQCNKHGGVVGFYSFPPLAEMRSIWDKQYGERKWSSQVEWGVSPTPTLGDLLKERV
jgi:Family of unknown function (DUF5906)